MDNKTQETLQELENKLKSIDSAVELITSAGEASTDVTSTLNEVQKSYFEVLENIKNEFNSLDDKLQKGISQINVESSQITEIRKEYDKSISELKSHLERFRDMELTKTLDALNTKLNTLNEKVDAVDVKNQKVEEKIENNHNELLKLENEQEKSFENNLNGQLNNLRSRELAKQASDLDGLKNLVNQHNKEIQELQNKTHKQLKHLGIGLAITLSMIVMGFISIYVIA